MKARPTHLKSFLFTAFGAVLLCAHVSCKTNQSSSANLTKTNPQPGDQEEAILENTSAEQLEQVNPTMWSPTQRQSTAAFYYLKAELLALEGDTARSAPIFEAAYNLDANPFLGAKMIMAKATAGGGDEALTDARRMVLLYPMAPSLRLLNGQLLASRGMYIDAVKELEKAIDLDPKQEPPYLQLMELHQNAGDLSRAIAVAKDLVAALPSSISGLSALSRLYLATKQHAKALSPAEQAYNMQSNNPELCLIYAFTLEKNGKSRQAVQMYEQLYRLGNINDEVIARMVALYREIGDLRVALDLLDDMAKAKEGNTPGVAVQRAFILWELKRFKEASAILNKLAEEHPDSDRLQYMAGLGQERVGEEDRALNTYKLVPENSSMRVHADFRSATIYKAKKDYAAAMVIADSIVSRFPQNPDSYTLKASIFGDQDQLKPAIAALNQGLAAVTDERARLLFLRGVYEEKADLRKECIITMREVIKLDPKNASALNFLGYLFAEQGENLDEAEELITRALNIRPDDGFYLDSMGWVYYQRGDMQKALATLERALKHTPGEGAIMEHLGDVKKALKAFDEAKRYYERALQTKLEPKEKLRIEKKLAELSK